MFLYLLVCPKTSRSSSSKRNWLSLAGLLINLCCCYSPHKYDTYRSLGKTRGISDLLRANPAKLTIQVGQAGFWSSLGTWTDELKPDKSTQLFSYLCLMSIYTTPLLNYCQFSRHVAGNLSITRFDVSYSAIHLVTCVIIWSL